MRRTLGRSMARPTKTGRPGETGAKRDLAPVPAPRPTNVEDLAWHRAVQAVRHYSAKALAPRTVAAYTRGMRQYRDFLAECRMPRVWNDVESVAVFLAISAQEGMGIADLSIALSAICEMFRLSDLPSPRLDPDLRLMWRGIQHEHGKPPRRVSAVTLSDLRAMLGSCSHGLVGRRDRALLLVGFAGAFRRSELSSMRVSDISASSEGLRILVRRSKTDQKGEGQEVGIPPGSDPRTDAVRAWTSWLEHAGLRPEDPAFPAMKGGRVSRDLRTGTPRPMSGGAVAELVKRSAARAGLPSLLVSGHSLRSGLATSAARAGKPLHSIMRQTRHKSVSMVERYIRAGRLLDPAENAAGGIGL